MCAWARLGLPQQAQKLVTHLYIHVGMEKNRNKRNGIHYFHIKICTVEIQERVKMDFCPFSIPTYTFANKIFVLL